jgi:hypothetical protein
MKELRKSIFLLLLISFLIGFFGSNGWAQMTSMEMQNSTDRTNLLDLLIARPLGIVAAAGGTCVFVITLPFTLPTRSVGESFKLFVVQPWEFSFVRSFPDESID